MNILAALVLILAASLTTAAHAQQWRIWGIPYVCADGRVATDASPCPHTPDPPIIIRPEEQIRTWADVERVMEEQRREGR